MSVGGRLLEVTNGGFVDAKREKPRLSVGQLWGNPTGGFGSLLPVDRPVPGPPDPPKFLIGNPPDVNAEVILT